MATQQENTLHRRITLPVVLILLGGMFSVLWSVKREDHEQRQLLQEQVQLLARTVDTDLLKAFIAGGMKRDSSEFAAIHHHLRMVLHLIPDGSYIYLMAQGEKPEEVIFLMDVEHDLEPEDPIVSGELYVDASPQLIESVQTGREFVEGPLPDEWGVWISGFAPVWDTRSDELLALLGIDIDATAWRKSIYRAGFIPALMTLITLLYVIRIQHLFQKQLQKDRVTNQNLEALYTFGFGLLLNFAFAHSIFLYEREVLKGQLRENGILLANELTSHMREVDRNPVWVPALNHLSTNGSQTPGDFESLVQPFFESPYVQRVHQVRFAQETRLEWVVGMGGESASASFLEEGFQKQGDLSRTFSILLPGKSLWIVRPVPDKVDEFLVVEVNLGRLLTARYRYTSPHAENQVAMLIPYLLQDENKKVQVCDKSKSMAGDLLLIQFPWKGMGESFLIEIRPKSQTPIWRSII